MPSFNSMKLSSLIELANAKLAVPTGADTGKDGQIGTVASVPFPRNNDNWVFSANTVRYGNIQGRESLAETEQAPFVCKTVTHRALEKLPMVTYRNQIKTVIKSGPPDRVRTNYRTP
nr:BFH_HP1_G0048640.mRNA.1.CDS.1 [Saccharomyces cerevisiae]